MVTAVAGTTDVAAGAVSGVVEVVVIAGIGGRNGVPCAYAVDDINAAHRAEEKTVNARRVNSFVAQIVAFDMADPLRKWGHTKSDTVGSSIATRALKITKHQQ